MYERMRARAYVRTYDVRILPLGGRLVWPTSWPEPQACLVVGTHGCSRGSLLRRGGSCVVGVEFGGGGGASERLVLVCGVRLEGVQVTLVAQASQVLLLELAPHLAQLGMFLEAHER